MDIQLLIKKITNTLNPEEEREFLDWINENPAHSEYFKKFEEGYLNKNLSVNKDQAWKKIKKSITRQNRPFKYWKYSSAAIFAIAISGYLFVSFFKTADIPQEMNGVVTIEKKVTLTLDNGEHIDLTEELNNINYFKKTGNHLIYDNKTNSNPLEFNLLSIPKGEQFFIQLSDGTKIWLNSDTQIKYPVTFMDNTPRVVELIYGEAFFEVSPSNENAPNNFIVKTGLQVVEVVGTKFNIKAYKEDKEIQTTLAEGIINLKDSLNNFSSIQPGYKGIYRNGNWKLLKIDPRNEIAWINGFFTFKNRDLEEIMLGLSRWYDVSIDYTDDDLKSLKFSGVFRKSQSIEEILTILQSTGEMEYNFVEKEIVLSPPPPTKK